LLSFAYVYFLESGLFNGLRPIQIKNFLPLGKPPWLSMQRVAPHDDVRRPVAELWAIGRVISSDHSCGFFFGQENVCSANERHACGP
jgi:hypothetical protein